MRTPLKKQHLSNNMLKKWWIMEIYCCLFDAHQLFCGSTVHLFENGQRNPEDENESRAVSQALSKYPHLRSSCSLEHLGQIQEIRHLSSQVVKCKDCKCGYLDKASICIIFCTWVLVYFGGVSSRLETCKMDSRKILSRSCRNISKKKKKLYLK